MIVQILNGTIDPGWVIAVLMAICIILLTRLLNRMQRDIADNKKDIVEVSKDVAEVKIDVGILKSQK